MLDDLIKKAAIKKDAFVKFYINEKMRFIGDVNQELEELRAVMSFTLDKPRPQPYTGTSEENTFLLLNDLYKLHAKVVEKIKRGSLGDSEEVEGETIQ